MNEFSWKGPVRDTKNASQNHHKNSLSNKIAKNTPNFPIPVHLTYPNLNPADLSKLLINILFSRDFLQITYNKLKKHVNKNFSDDQLENYENLLDTLKFNKLIKELDDLDLFFDYFDEVFVGQMRDIRPGKIFLALGKSKFSVSEVFVISLADSEKSGNFLIENTKSLVNFFTSLKTGLLYSKCFVFLAQEGQRLPFKINKKSKIYSILVNQASLSSLKYDEYPFDANLQPHFVSSRIVCFL